jgi:hypothetical protein
VCSCLEYCRAFSPGSPQCILVVLPKSQSESVASAWFHYGVCRQFEPPYIMSIKPSVCIKPDCVSAMLRFMTEHPNTGLAYGHVEAPDGWVYFAVFLLRRCRVIMCVCTTVSGEEALSVWGAARRFERELSSHLYQPADGVTGWVHHPHHDIVMMRYTSFLLSVHCFTTSIRRCF